MEERAGIERQGIYCPHIQSYFKRNMLLWHFVVYYGALKVKYSLKNVCHKQDLWQVTKLELQPIFVTRCRRTEVLTNLAVPHYTSVDRIHTSESSLSSSQCKPASSVVGGGCSTSTWASVCSPISRTVELRGDSLSTTSCNLELGKRIMPSWYSVSSCLAFSVWHPWNQEMFWWNRKILSLYNYKQK